MQNATWKVFLEHFFVFDAQKKVLSFFKSKSSISKPQGTILLDSFILQSESNEKFSISTTEETYHFAAPNQAEKNRWVDVFSPHAQNTESSFQDPSSARRDEFLEAKFGNLLVSPSDKPIRKSTEVPGTVRRKKVHAVPCIAVEERYILADEYGDRKRDLMKAAQELSDAMRQNFPNQANLIVYDLTSTPAAHSAGVKHIGNLEVHRVLDRTSPHISVFDKTPDLFAKNLPYALIKVQPFLKKCVTLNTLLKLLSEDSSKQSSVDEAVAAILCDVAHEFTAFSKATKIEVHALSVLNVFHFTCLRKFSDINSKLASNAGEIVIKLVVEILIIAECCFSQTLTKKATEKCLDLLYHSFLEDQANVSSLQTLVQQKLDIAKNAKSYYPLRETVWLKLQEYTSAKEYGEVASDWEIKYAEIVDFSTFAKNNLNTTTK